MSHDWQSKRTVLQCNDEMLQTGILSDIHFLVGKKRQRIPAHRYMLASRSSVFFTMLTQSAGAKDKPIIIDDVDPIIFREILRYIYTEEADITPSNVTAVYSAAKQFSLGNLMDHCLRVLGDGIVVERVCAVLEQAHQFNGTELMEHCLEFIYKNAHAVLKSSSFLAHQSTKCSSAQIMTLQHKVQPPGTYPHMSPFSGERPRALRALLFNLCPECVGKIIEPDELKASEAVVYEAVYSWSTKACKKNKLPLNSDSRHRLLGNVRYMIRFPIMDAEYFTRVVSNQDLLTKDEKITMFQYFHSRTSPKVMQFITRRRHVTRAIRFNTTSGAWNVGKIADCIRVQASHDVVLDGVVVYGCFVGTASYDIIVKILDQYNTVLSEMDLILETNSKVESYDIMLEDKVKLKALTWYTAYVYMDGPQTKRGVSGKTMVYCEQVQFLYKTTSLAMNCTTENEGQIAGVIFHD